MYRYGALLEFRARINPGSPTFRFLLCARICSSSVACRYNPQCVMGFLWRKLMNHPLVQHLQVFFLVRLDRFRQCIAVASDAQFVQKFQHTGCTVPFWGGGTPQCSGRRQCGFYHCQRSLFKIIWHPLASTKRSICSFSVPKISRKRSKISKKGPTEVSPLESILFCSSLRLYMWLRKK